MKKSEVKPFKELLLALRARLRGDVTALADAALRKTRSESSGDSVVLIRMDPGCGYPAHRHAGEERVLVLHGGYRDEGGRYLTGSRQVNPPGSFHSPAALDGGESCVLLAAIEGGVDLS